ncbi:MAG TPA: BON domain-containing protein [Casimicrobiaceae bacterium]|nr:BON domain-containing protein [Casimicrobiaceae bacterium]
MRDDSRPSTTHATLMAALLGAAAMYMLDPDKGRRRRAIARDRALSVANGAAGVSGAAVRDLRQRLQGLTARVRRMRDAEIPTDDLRLIERVRSRIGRVVAHPHALHVGALDGRVTLSGPILAREVAPLLAAVRTVAGVRDVDDHFIVHEQAGSVPALQGEGRPPAVAAGRRWPPALRVAAVAGGTVLVLQGVRRRGLLGTALAVAGAAVAARGALDRPLGPVAPAGSAALQDEPPHVPAPPVELH